MTISGFANINKPASLTSSDVVVRVRRCLPRGTKVGHMGTLDPMAMGVLPIGIGKATRLFDFVIDKGKEYIAEMRLGVTTDTQDSTGSILSQRPAYVSRAALEAAASAFLGDIMQIPPAYSAVKKDGKRLYQIAREGGDASAEPRRAHIDAIDLLSFSGETALLRVACGRGTYIRTLIHDLGEAVGCGAHMAFLARTRTGPFRIAEALSPDTFRELVESSKAPLVPMDAPLMHLPALYLSDTQRPDVRNGRALHAALMPGLMEGAACRAYLKGAFAGILQREGGLLRWKAMLLEDEA